eukprot:TRINITY_DN26323_c0_g1_i1.p1 TRINITY_DN26323_c0_g1~~TRINITY_DN26323_c0_g1_i1.p1  ORF type:complete len:108 (-),score=23.75 TRINITY_DN26323_c0_g1_i1:144-467(-)
MCIRDSSTFDIDGNGYVNALEMRAIMDLLGEDLEDSLLATMIRMFDDNNNGQIGWEEFYAKITGRVNLKANIRRRSLERLNCPHPQNQAENQCKKHTKKAALSTKRP